MHWQTLLSQMTYSALITGTPIPLEQPGVKSPAEGHTDGDDCRDRSSNLLLTSSLHHKSNEAISKISM